MWFGRRVLLKTPNQLRVSAHQLRARVSKCHRVDPSQTWGKNMMTLSRFRAGKGLRQKTRLAREVTEHRHSKKMRTRTRNRGGSSPKLLKFRQTDR